MHATKDVLARHGFALKKALGQNFLVNDAVVGKILDLAEISGGDAVLEVGPGIGTLTSALLPRARSVVAVEKDAALPPVLADTLAPWARKFALVEKDALALDAADVERASAVLGSPPPTKFVANLPYAVAATVVLDYFQRFDCLESATVMVQREVADRMGAKPGTKAYGAYTVKLALFARKAGSFNVPPASFMPPPHVESTVIRLDRAHPADEAGRALPPVAIEAACAMADAAFFARRKTIANSCRQYFASRGGLDAEGVAAVLDRAGIPPAVRGETLPPERYLALGRAYREMRPQGQDRCR